LGTQLQLEWAGALNTLGDSAAAGIAEPLIERAQALDAPDLAAKARFIFGVARYRQGDQQGARQTLEAALTEARAQHLVRLEAECLLSLGDILMYQADPQGQ